jgi:hypothetical protein
MKKMGKYGKSKLKNNVKYNLLGGQKFISTLLSDILTILGIIWACKVFLDYFYN